MLDNELKLVLKAATKIVKKRLEEKPKGGIIIDDDNRIKFKELLAGLEKLDTYFALVGAFSLGICGDCKKWITAGHNSKHNCVGSCKGGKGSKDACHEYDCCDQHSEVK